MLLSGIRGRWSGPASKQRRKISPSPSNAAAPETDETTGSRAGARPADAQKQAACPGGGQIHLGLWGAPDDRGLPFRQPLSFLPFEAGPGNEEREHVLQASTRTTCSAPPNERSLLSSCSLWGGVVKSSALNRDVAIKVLPAAFATGFGARRSIPTRGAGARRAPIVPLKKSGRYTHGAGMLESFSFTVRLSGYRAKRSSSSAAGLVCAACC